MEKDLVFITSPGRTGTMFFSQKLPLMIDGAFATHEPDVYYGWSDTTNWRKIREFGLYHMVLGRLLGKTGARNLAKAYRAGRLAHDEAIRKVQSSRERYFLRRKEPLIIEANAQWPLLLPVLRDAFPRAKIVCITRKQGAWIKSFQGHGGRYDSSDRVARSRVSPADFGEMSTLEWEAKPQVDKLAWEWSLLTRALERFAFSDVNARLFTYEDLFLSDGSAMVNMLSFIADHGNRKYRVLFDREMMAKRVNAS